MRTAVIIAALIGGSVGTEPVVITTAPAPFERVSFGDLNLGSTDGQKALKARIRGAARRVCTNGGDHTFDTYLATHSCYVWASNDGLRQMQEVVAKHNSGAATVTAALTVHAGEDR
jgi:UrcA family protein